MAEPLPGAARDIVERIRLSFRAWAPAEVRPPRPAGRLPGGQSNLSVLLRGEQGAWVLRIPRQDRPDGVDYARECFLHELAAAHSLAPALALAEPDTGLLVTAYLAQGSGETGGDGGGDSGGERGGKRGGDGVPPGPAMEGIGSGDRHDSPEALARFLRAIHALDPTGLPASGRTAATTTNDDGSAIDLSPLDAAAELERLRGGPGPTDPLRDLPRDTQRCLLDAAERSRGRPGGAVICHNDLLRSNRLSHEGRLVAIDWEYARPGDPFFDLAVVASEFDPAQRAALLAAYLQRRPTARDEEHLADQLILYRAIATCWYRRHGSTSAARAALTALVACSRAAMPTAHRPGE